MVQNLHPFLDIVLDCPPPGSILQQKELKRKEIFSSFLERLANMVTALRLGVARSATTTPIFQAFIDYRLIPGDNMMWGDCQSELMSFRLSKMAYDVAMDIIDNPNGDCSLTFIFRDDLYSQADAERLAKSYLSLAKAFADQSNTTMGSAKVYDEVEIKDALSCGRGKIFFSHFLNPLLRMTEVGVELMCFCP